MALVKATHRHARISPHKVYRFAELIRGMSAEDGMDQLRYVPNRGARMLAKVLRSAMANAETRGARNVDRLRIVEARVDGGPMFKRIRPRARGMAFEIKKRTSHLHIGLDAPELT